MEPMDPVEPVEPVEPMENIPVLGGRHKLSIESFAVTTERMELRYRLTPPLPQTLSDSDSDSDDGDDEGPYVFLALEADDDVGNEYLDSGGAFGPSADGAATEGSLSVQPGPYADARSVTLRLTLFDGTHEETRSFTLPVD
ncbi:hypothetical protein [Streptomyces capitiformicae]|uniref:Uncharacterized protein n=1 Tax=Streptomyces capitiformicae TaxID=2014920 RepID=A0A919DIF8_9ACTN|nr:hypothetical protein [Streptomyces capitiformicae]GHE45621.1 hypothetical protein GCM10017771_66120 [Streptomyces capitiformicae]